MKKVFLAVVLLVAVLLLGCSAAGADVVCPYSGTIYHDLVYTPVSSNNCSRFCRYCGYEDPDGWALHWSFCTFEDPSTCYLCGTTGLYYDEDPSIYTSATETIMVFHDGGYGGGLYYVDQGDCHELLCTNCDVSFMETHDVECDRPDYCRICGELGHEIAPEKMSHWDKEYVDVGNEHIMECKTWAIRTRNTRVSIGESVQTMRMSAVYVA